MANEIDWRTLDPEWIAQGRYGYYMVDEYRPGDGGHGTYGSSIGPFRTRKLAERVAGALNDAYRRGQGK